MRALLRYCRCFTKITKLVYRMPLYSHNASRPVPVEERTGSSLMSLYGTVVGIPPSVHVCTAWLHYQVDFVSATNSENIQYHLSSGA